MRRFVVVGLLVAFLVAGFGSYYASSHPDGLNFVAEKTGFLDKEKDSATSDGPFAGYSTKGIDNERLSGAVAGIAGAALVLVLMGGLTWVVRRRGAGAEGDPEAETVDAGADRTGLRA